MTATSSAAASSAATSSGATSPAAAADTSAGDDLDVVIVGGGIAGLWLLNLLHQQGYRCLLCEAQALGSAQTIASQGMIHGGLKYALDGALTGASEAIARMPERWRACLNGRGDIDLSAVPVVSEHYYMFASGALGRLGGFLASQALRGRVSALSADAYPEFFRHPEFGGSVYLLEDPVLDVPALLSALAAPVTDALHRARVDRLELDATGNVRAVLCADGAVLRARQYLFCAGSGNAVFASALQRAGHGQAPHTQSRPLHQVFVRHPDITPLFAHCLTGVRRAEPRLTITSHPLEDGTVGWYLGGQLATEGVRRDAQRQREVARGELAVAVPWLDWNRADIQTLRIDRAEPRQPRGARPDEACVVRCGNALLTWPTKLSLVPDLGDQVRNAIDPPPSHTRTALPRSNTAPTVARAPWLSAG